MSSLSSYIRNHSPEGGITRRGALKLAAAAVAGLGLVSSVPSPALAEPRATDETLNALSDAESRYEAAQQQLQAVGAELEDLGYKVEDSEAQIATVQANIDGVQEDIDAKEEEIRLKERDILRAERQIRVREAEIGIKQRRLAERVSSAYKAGPESILSVVLNSSSMEQFISGLTYLDKIAERDRRQIEEVQGLKEQLEQERALLEEQRLELEAQKAELEEQRDALEADKARLVELENQLLAQQASLEAKEQEAAALVSSLDAEVQELMARRDAEIQAAREEEERKAREAAEAAVRAAAERAGNSNVGTPALVDGDTRGNIVRAALSLLGTPYVWGGTWPTSGGTDCSGLCQWAYAQAGFSIPRTTYTQRPACERAGHLFYDTSLLQPGDLVFCNQGRHVVMYIGNSMVVHDPHPGAVVCTAPLSNFSIVAMGFPIP